MEHMSHSLPAKAQVPSEKGVGRFQQPAIVMIRKQCVFGFHCWGNRPRSKEVWKGKDLFHLEVLETELTWGHGRTLLPDLLSFLSHRHQNHLSRVGNTHHGLGPPTSIINEDNSSQVCP